MSAYTGDIVKDGLTLYLDAANYKSFVSGSTTWYDLARPGFTGSLINGPAYTGSNKGAIIFDGTNDYVAIPSSSLISSSQMTFSVWNFGVSSRGGSVIWFVNNAGTRILNVHLYTVIYFDAGNGSGNYLGVFDRIDKSVTSAEYEGWNYWTFTKNSAAASMRIYRNGELWHSGGGSAPIGASSGSAFLCYGGPSHGYHPGRLGTVKLYSRELSAAEIRENYNATKGRYDTTRSSDAIKPRLSTSGLVLHLDAANYRSFVSGSSTWRDLSGNGFNGTLTNGPTFSTESGGELVFDGSNDYVTVPSLTDFATSNQFTAIIWAKSAFSTWNEYGFLISRRNQFVIHPDLNTRNVSFYIHSPIGGSGGFYNVGWTPSDITVYNQYCMTYNAGTLAAYGNGILRQSSAVGATLSSDTGKTEIGKDEDLNRYLNGRIGLVQIYNRALSASEILQNYNLAKGRFGYVR